MSRESAVSAIERGDLSELQHVLEESEWDIGSEPLNSKGQTALHIACANDHLDIVQYLVNKKGCSVTVKDVYGHTPQMLSFITKHWKMANFLLQFAPDSSINNLVSCYNKSMVIDLAKEALAASCKEGYFELVKYLIKSEWHTVDHKEIIKLTRCFDNLHIVKYLLTHCQCTMPDDMSEVHVACIQGDIEKVKTLDSNGSSLLGTADDYGTAPIHYAILEPNLLRMIVQYAGEMLLNVTDCMGNTPLHHSIKYECIESVTILVEAPGCDVNLANLKGETPLIAACKYSNSDIVQLLVASERCNLSTCDDEGNTPLHVTISEKALDQLQNVQCLLKSDRKKSIDQLKNVQCLLQSDRCDPNAINKSGCTPLHIVCHRGDIPLLEALVADKRCDLNIQDGNGDTALHIGVENVEVVKCLLESDRSRCDIYNEEGLTPFHKAIANGVMASVEVMLKNGVNILQTSNDIFQNTPIHIACIHSRLESLKVLLSSENCDPNQQNARGDTALHIVCRMRTANVLQSLEVLTSLPGINPTLVNHEGMAPCDVVDNDGNTLLHIACAKGNSEIVVLLVKYGADVLKLNGDGDAPIHIVCEHFRLAILKILLGYKTCDPNQQNSKGDTALHIVCQMRTGRELQFLEVLTSTPGINPTLVNDKGISPFEVLVNNGNTLLHNACVKRNTTMVELLVKSGANVLKPNRYGDPPIHIACKNARLDIIKLVLNSTNCDPNQQNAEGDTALHIVCRMRNGTEVAFLEVLTSTPGINPTLVNHEGIASCDVIGIDGNTLLHIACAEGNTTLVELLVKNKANVLTLNHEGNAAIHTACMNSRLESLKVLLSCNGCDPSQQNSKGDTALHIVCRMRTGRELQFLEVLTSTPGINPTLVNHEGIAPCDAVGNDGNALLHIACAKGNSEIVVLLVKNGADILKLNQHGDAPIHIVCKHSRLAILNSLLGYKSCDPNQQNSKGDTALHIVCQMRTGEEFEFLEVLTSTPRINSTLVNHEGIAPIHTACMNSRLESLKVLLSCESCDPNQQNTRGDTALHIVCRMRTANVLQFLEVLTSTPGINLALVNHEGIAPCDAVGNDGNALLHIACAKGNSEIVVLLVKNGADILKLNEHGDAPIHIVCKHSRLAILNSLLGYKSCNPNQQNSKGDTALHIVCQMRTGKEFEFLEVLTSTPGINSTLLNHEGNAPIHTACMNFRLELLKVLLSCESCDPNQQNTRGDTALHIVCSMRTGNVLQFLTSTPGINPTLVNDKGISPFEVLVNNGNTLLHNACVKGNTTMVELLVKNGADVLKPNRYGDPPIHIACKNARLDIIKLVLNGTNCDPNQQNAEGDTALHIVCRMRNGTEVAFLEVLTSTPGINSTLLNHEGNAPIHTACINFRLELLKVLLSCESCDPNQQNTRGDTALHIVCRMRTGNVLQFLEVLTSTPGINPTLVNDKGISPFEVLVNNGNTLLHNACVKGNTTMVELLVKNGADVLKPNRYGDTPIHIACKHARLDILKLVLNCTNCDPNQQNAEGDTALHIVCRMRTGSILQFLEVLTSTRGINPTLVNHKGIGPFEEVDGNGNTLLHDACIEGDTRLARLLLKNGVDVLKRNRHGDAPIHFACKYARLDILKLVLNSTNCDPNQQNASGDTALHIACRKKFPNENQILNTLTSTVGIDPEIVNHNGRTPIEVEGINYTAIDTMKTILEHKKSSIQAYLKIFVVGNSGTGKSTLIKAVTTEASQLRKYAPLSKMKHVNPSDVPPHTAGIVPIPFSSKHFGNAVLYDFAGQHEYYSSHAAVMENLILPSPPLFLLLIDISKSKEVIREELVYWWHFINNQSQKAAAPPHVILAGSHKDMVKLGDREEVEIMIRDCIKRISVTFKFFGYFPLNCRKLVSQGLSALLTQLNTTCQTLRRNVDVNFHCHILNALLRAPEFQDLVYCKLVDIIDKIESDDAPLPKAFSQLIPLLASLNDQGYILLLQNHTDESKSWVILKPDVLLTEVNGSLFAPEYFKEHSEFAMSTGVVTLSKLKEKFTEYSHEVIVEYLTHLEFCFRIKDQHTLDMITNNEVYESTTTEGYYFFPSLVRVENPTDVCQSHQSIGYEYGWLYKCSKETEQLTTRFLHVLILRLAFACDPPDDPTETESVVLLRSCSVWKHGIAWWTNDGIEVIIEVGLQCRWVAVMLRCPDVKTVQCAELRSKVIHSVLQAKVDFCPTIFMTEYLIAPSSLKYPLEGRELTLYSMREVARAAIKGKEYAKDTRGKNLITLPQLLPFEPFHNMGDLIWKFFSGDTSVAVTPEELTQLAGKCHDKLADMNTAFKADIGSFQKECMKADCTEVERCVALFRILQRRGRFKTWRDFQLEFSRFSIFCEQNPLENTGRFSESGTPLTSPSVKDDVQKDKVTALEDDKHESSVTSDSVRESEDVTRSLSSPEKESHSQPVPKAHMSSSATDLAVTGPKQHSKDGSISESAASICPDVLPTSRDDDQIMAGTKQYSKEEGISESAANISNPDVVPTSRDDICDQKIAENVGKKPVMKDLANQVIPTVCPMWRDIGLQLNLDISILNEIRANCQGDVRECCTIMFKKWLDQDTKASWCTVLSACRTVKDNLLLGPDGPCTKDHIKVLTLLISTLPVFLATL